MSRPGYTLLLVLLVFCLAAAPALQTAFASLSLTQLGAEPYTALSGPYTELRLPFQLPSNWQLTEGSSLTLDLETYFSSFVPAQGDAFQENLIAGNLAVLLDGTLLERHVLSYNGESQVQVPLPLSAFAAGLEHELVLAWDASTSCALNLSTTVIVQPSSALNLAQAPAAYQPALAQLPYPFFGENQIQHPGTLLVLPNNPSATLVSAALQAVAGMGRGANSAISITTEGQVFPSLLDERHLIFVGPQASFSLLSDVAAPAAPAGYLAVLRSPWNPGLGLLLIGGRDEAETLLAAEQAGSGALIANSSGTLAEVNARTIPAAPEERSVTSFEQLGLADSSFSRYGQSQVSLPFYVSPDRPVSTQAYLDLRFAHSKLLDYLRSGLHVELNSQPLATLRLSDQTAARHSELVVLSPTALRPGWNELQLSAQVQPLDLCAEQAAGEHWLSVFRDSSLNLPSLDGGVAPSEDGHDLSQLWPLFGGRMEQTSLLLSRDPQSWQAAARFLRGLASQSWPRLPQVAFVGDAAPTAENLIVLGTLSDADQLPGQPSFVDAATNEVVLHSGQRFRFEDGSQLGLLATQEEEGARILYILGSDSAGLESAVRQLLDPALAARLSGADLLLVQADTALADQIVAEEVESATTEAPSIVQAPQNISTGRLYLALLLLLLLAALVLLAWSPVQDFAQSRLKKPR